MNAKQKIEELEKRVKELEMRPPQIVSYPVYIPYPHYVWPSYPYMPMQPYWYGANQYGNQAIGIGNYQQSLNDYQSLSSSICYTT
jgi:hypothetical protein